MTDNANSYLTADDAPEYLKMFPGALELWVGIVEEQGIPSSNRTALSSFCCAQSELARAAQAKQLFEDGREHQMWSTADSSPRVHFVWELQRIAMEEMSEVTSALGISSQAIAVRGENVADFFDHKFGSSLWDEE